MVNTKPFFELRTDYTDGFSYPFASQFVSALSFWFVPLRVDCIPIMRPALFFPFD